MGANRPDLGFKSLHNLGVKFKGVFQCRLGTDADSSTEARGYDGWTFAYADEPDLDRVIRFNSAESPRLHAPDVGVIITDAVIDNQYVSDSLIGQAVNLGSDSYFDGSNGANGREPIMNFEFHIGNDDDYIHCQTRDPPVGGGAHNTSFPLPMRLEALVNSRIQKLRLGEDDISKARLQKIRRSLWSIYYMEVTYSITLDVHEYNPLDSEIIESMKEMGIPNLDLQMNLYGFDGDGLVGYVNGTVMGQYR
jgi:hypothetical protein